MVILMISWSAHLVTILTIQLISIKLIKVVIILTLTLVLIILTGLMNGCIQVNLMHMNLIFMAVLS